MSYIKLTAKLRRAMDEIEQTMRASGYKTDLRWLEEHAGVCPICGRTGGRIGTLSTVAVPQTMTHIPYSVCEDCVTAHFDKEQGGFGEESTAKIEATILDALGIASGESYMEKVPEGLRPALQGMMNLQREGIGINPTWLQTRAMECPGCGQVMTNPVKVGISVTTAYGRPVAVPYLVCPNCADIADEDLNELVRPRIMAMLEQAR